MKGISGFIKLVFVLCVGTMLFPGCQSTTQIVTDPPGATVYVDGVNSGTTPLKVTNAKTIISCTDIRIEKEGYKRIETEICRDGELKLGAAVCGYCILIPALWALDYKPSYFYELIPEERGNYFNKDSKESKLKELKELYEKDLISKKEYEKAKEEILRK